MPRRSSISGADAMPACPFCLGMGQVADPRNVDPAHAGFGMIACPYCGGLGRLAPGVGNSTAVAGYRRAQGAARRAVRTETAEAAADPGDQPW